MLLYCPKIDRTEESVDVVLPGEWLLLLLVVVFAVDDDACDDSEIALV